jgi:NitT/TauT family transport system substrate-binding protein
VKLLARRRLRAVAAIGALTLAAGALTACGSNSTGSGSSNTLRLGYFTNLTHATALVGVKEGFFQQSLGGTELKTQTFNAGPTAIEALLAGAIDATYIGPNPSINAFVKSKGDAIRIIAGATAGGASLVVQPTIGSAADLKGQTVASPQLGNTQDVALRYWLKQQGVQTSVTGSSEVNIAPTDNATTLQLFKDKKIAGAWVPEPWASRLVLEGGGKVLVNEASQWPGGRFVTTQLIVRTKFLQENPTAVDALLKGHVKTTEWIAANPAKARLDANAQLKALTTKELTPQVLARAWSQLTITVDPIASTLQACADHAYEVGTLKEQADLKGIYDLAPLNKILVAQGKKPVSAAGLGQA